MRPRTGGSGASQRTRLVPGTVGGKRALLSWGYAGWVALAAAKRPEVQVRAGGGKFSKKWFCSSAAAQVIHRLGQPTIGRIYLKNLLG